MSSLFGSMAGAVAQAVEGAAIGQAIGDANDRASHNARLANQWCEHAKKLERTVEELKAKLRRAETLQKSSDKLETLLNASRADLTQRLASSKNELLLARHDAEISKGFNNANKLIIQETKLEKRAVESQLLKMQKCLKHSGAQTESLAYVVSVYECAFGDLSSLSASGKIPAGAKEKAEEIRHAFLGGDKLTNSKEIQAMIDQALMPERKPGVII